MDIGNAEIAGKLREIATAYTIKKGNQFQIRAYENAADAIEHSTSDVKDLFEMGTLDQIPGIGDSLKAHLEELFKTGKVKHWEEIKKGIPKGVFDFLNIPGIGPQTALKLSKAGVKDLDDLEHKIGNGELLANGFFNKQVEKLQRGLAEAETIKTGRMLLPYAYTQAQKILDYLKQSSDVEEADVLGSLRRMVATVGDLDFAVSSDSPEKVVNLIAKMPGIKEVIDQGEDKITVVLSSGIHVDFIIVSPESYGALLQHFTGSKAHNIKLREIAHKMGYSLSEYGIKPAESGRLKMDDGNLTKIKTEEELYKMLGMQTPPPEIREDTGEIEAALKHNLPDLVELKDIKGDLHIHSDLISKPSHDIGANSVKEIITEAKSLDYAYIGISDHQPAQSDHNRGQMIKVLQERKKAIEHINFSEHDFRVLNLLEVDILPDGSLGVPNEALKYLDFALAGVHSVHHQSKELMTKRILKALVNPNVKVLTHPTNRLLNQRESSDVDWEEIFQFCAAHQKALEISAFPDRLDLPDILARQAKEYGVKFVINTDAHEVSQMELMHFGVSVARRGWLTKEDVVNSWEWTKFAKWCNIKL